jgi:hypothetical protein
MQVGKYFERGSYHVIYLLPYHHELDPIEFIWAQIKAPSCGCEHTYCLPVLVPPLFLFQLHTRLEWRTVYTYEFNLPKRKCHKEMIRDLLKVRMVVSPEIKHEGQNQSF